MLDPPTIWWRILAKGSDGGCNSYMIWTEINKSCTSCVNTAKYSCDQLTSSPSCPSYVTRKVTKKTQVKVIACPTAYKVLVDLQNQIKDELFDDCDKEQDTKYKTILQSIVV